MVKYFLTYKGISGDKDTQGATYLFEILEDGFNGETIEINGYVNHNYADRKDLLQSVVASSLDISLEADENLTLQDLYTEEESKFKVQLKRNDQVIFYGILKPDGIWEDFVSDRWEISMDAMDGLSILKDLSFVKDDGTFYVGKITQFEALKQCLHRIGYDLPINISTDIPVYDGFMGTDSVLKSVLMNADRFYQDAQKNNIMDCEAVLKSVLEPYSATIVQMNGEWWIFRPIDVKNEMNFYRYDGEVKTDIAWNAELNIGSHIDQYEIFHANANQKKSINPSTQAFRVNYKYGLVRLLSANSELIQNPINSLNIDGWSIDNSHGDVYPHPSGQGVFVGSSDNIEQTLISLNQIVTVKENDILNIDISFFYVDFIAFGINKYIQVFIATENYYLKDSGWVLKSGTTNEFAAQINIKNNRGDGNWSIPLPPAPEDSNLSFSMYIDIYSISNPNFAFHLRKIEIKPSAGNFKGEFHTAQRLTRISSVTKADKTVSVGDSISDIYLGTLYKADGNPTEFWPTKPLLQLMVEDALRIAPRPMYFFEGDVFGYFPYLSHVLINNIAGRYQVSKYSFDTKKNVNRCNFKEFDNVVLIQDTDYRYEFDYDYGNETKVTIKP